MPSILATTEGNQYRVLQRLAEGGCADIFLAETLAASRHREPYVIAKRLRPGDPALLGSALTDEARLIARFDHPGIPRLLDIAEDPDGPCLILECLHGENLEDVLGVVARTHQRVPYPIAVRIAADLAAALHHAHERTGADGTPLQVVHRDVSPSNAVMTYGGQVKLLDFGIARWKGVSQHTQVGFVKGKAPYMSPEQCVQGDVDRRSDLFSLGTLLYELTTLVTPFGSAYGDEDAIMRRIVDGAYHVPEALVPDCPTELSAIIARCLQPVRELRYRTGEELRRDLLALGCEASDQELAAWLRGLFGDRSPPWVDDAPTPPPEEAVPPLRRRLLVISISFWVTIALGLLGGSLLT